MGILRRFKQIALVTGTATILAGLALVGVVVYLWWDSKGDLDDPDAGTDIGTETGFESNTETDTEMDTQEETTAE